MKFLLAICLAIGFAGVYCSKDDKPEDIQRIKECAKKNNLDDKMVEDLKNSKSFTMNQNTMCFIQCGMEGIGMMDAEGKLTEKFMKVPHADDCKTISGKDKCETAAKVMDCILDKDGVTLRELNL